jgi:hypothetical protein
MQLPWPGSFVLPASSLTMNVALWVRRAPRPLGGNGLAKTPPSWASPFSGEGGSWSGHPKEMHDPFYVVGQGR